MGQFIEAGIDCYQTVVDDQGIDAVIRAERANGIVRYFDVQVKSAKSWNAIRGRVADLGARKNTILVLFNSTTSECLWLDSSTLKARFPSAGSQWGDVFLTIKDANELKAAGHADLGNLRAYLEGHTNK